MWPHTRIIFLQHKTHWIFFFFRVYPIGGQWVNWLDVLTSLFSAASAVGPHPYHPDGPVLSVLSADARHLSLGLLRFGTFAKRQRINSNGCYRPNFSSSSRKKATRNDIRRHMVSPSSGLEFFFWKKKRSGQWRTYQWEARQTAVSGWMCFHEREGGGGGALLSWRGAYWLSDGKWLQHIKSNGPIFFLFNLLL